MMTETSARKAKTDSTETSVALEMSQVVQSAIVSLDCTTSPCKSEVTKGSALERKSYIEGNREGEKKKGRQQKTHERFKQNQRCLRRFGRNLMCTGSTVLNPTSCFFIFRLVTNHVS